MHCYKKDKELPKISSTRKKILGLLVFVAVLVRMTEQPGLMDKIGFDDGGTTCILDHGIWHIVAAAILCVVLMKPDRERVQPTVGAVKGSKTKVVLRLL